MRVVVLSILLTFLPLLSFAAPILGGPIVPQCSGPDCNACDLFQLVQNLINFAGGFSVIVATLMFVYAGVLYFTAATKEENIKTAHKIFGQVLLGLVFVLGAWLIVDVIMSVLLNKSFGPWHKIPPC